MKNSEDWPETALGDVADEVTVGFVGPMTAEYANDGIPFLRSQNIDPFRINTADLKYINKTFHIRICKSQLRPGDVVIVRTGKPGTAAVVPDWLPDANCADLVIVRPGKRLNPKFLAYFINSVAQDHIYAQLVGAVQQHFNIGSAKEMAVPVPSLAEQDEVVRVLGALDDKIDLNRRMNQTLETLSRTMFRSWFVDFDPVVAKAAGKRPIGMAAKTAALFPNSFQGSELGPIPKGWAVRSVASLAHYANGKNFTKSASGTGRMVIRIAELNSGAGESTVYNDVKAEEENTAFSGDVLFAWSGSLGVYRWHGDDSLVNQHIFKVVSKDYPQWFVYYQLQEAMDFFRGIAADKATTMGHIKREHMSQALLALPVEHDVIQAADRLILPLYNRIHRNERQNARLAAVRDALLPHLMLGGRRVPRRETNGADSSEDGICPGTVVPRLPLN
jgi:type I restriction enzyme S subunit